MDSFTDVFSVVVVPTRKLVKRGFILSDFVWLLIFLLSRQSSSALGLSKLYCSGMLMFSLLCLRSIVFCDHDILFIFSRDASLLAMIYLETCIITFLYAVSDILLVTYCFFYFLFCRFGSAVKLNEIRVGCGNRMNQCWLLNQNLLTQTFHDTVLSPGSFKPK